MTTFLESAAQYADLERVMRERGCVAFAHDLRRKRIQCLLNARFWKYPVEAIEEKPPHVELRKEYPRDRRPNGQPKHVHNKFQPELTHYQRDAAYSAAADAEQNISLGGMVLSIRQPDISRTNLGVATMAVGCSWKGRSNGHE